MSPFVVAVVVGLAAVAQGAFVSGLSFPTIVGNILAFNGGHPRDVPARSRARNAGNPDAFADLDGSRNTIGHLGGPYAAPATAVP